MGCEWGGGGGWWLRQYKDDRFNTESFDMTICDFQSAYVLYGGLQQPVTRYSF